MVQNLNLKEFFWVKIVCLESAEKSLKVFARKIASTVPGIDLSGEARTFPVASLSEKLKNICFIRKYGFGGHVCRGRVQYVGHRDHCNDHPFNNQP